MKQEVLNFKFGNKRFFITSENKLALNLISNWPGGIINFFYMALENVARRYM